MSPPLDDLFHRVGIAKGDLPASAHERRQAESWCELQRQHPGALSVTYQSVQATVEEAYHEYRRAKILRATRRRLQSDKLIGVFLQLRGNLWN
jgi:hypothetical protein